MSSFVCRCSVASDTRLASLEADCGIPGRSGTAGYGRGYSVHVGHTVTSLGLGAV